MTVRFVPGILIVRSLGSARNRIAVQPFNEIAIPKDYTVTPVNTWPSRFRLMNGFNE